MRAGARLAAAVEILDDISLRHRPAADALADWGKSHRFAGSGDRAAIGNVVYDALRRRQSLAARMGNDTSRALAIGAAPEALGLAPEEVAVAADGTAHAIEPLSTGEREGLARELPTELPAHVAGDFPEWLTPYFARVFGARAAEEGAALARRAPLDLRVNTLKATRAKVLSALEHFAPEPTPLSPIGVRLPAATGRARAPHAEAEAAHGKGWYEVQDEGSQTAALMTGAKAGEQVLDLCAGAGGKALAFAAMMGNTGQVYAYDRGKIELRPIFERLQRAGARNVQVLTAGDEAALSALGPRFDAVMVDAPCTGSGTWRRRPDAKWRLKPGQLALRRSEQRAVLALARGLVKPGGRLVYVTCSLLAEENTDQIAWFLGLAPEFSAVPFAEVWRANLGTEPPASADGGADALLLTPARHGTDGFFIATLGRVR